MGEPVAFHRSLPGVLRPVVLSWVASLAWTLAALVTLRWRGLVNLDLRVYRAAGMTLFRGDTYALRFTEVHLPFTYPPFALLVLSPLSLGRPAPVEVLWWVVNAVALVAIMYLALVSATRFRGREALALAATLAGVTAFAFEPVRSNLEFGQINLLLMLLVVVDITRMRAPWRGALIGIAAAVKLTPLLYLVYFLVSGDRHSARRGAGVFLASIVLGWLILPADSLRFWLHDLVEPQRDGGISYVGNQSWDGLVHRAPFNGDTLGVALWCLLVAATLVIGIVTASRFVRQGRVIDALLALALVELLVSPISWTHHWSWMVLAPVVVIERFNARLVGCEMLLFAIALVIIGPYWWSVSAWQAPIIGSSLVLTGAILLVSLARSARPEGLPAPRRSLPGGRGRHGAADPAAPAAGPAAGG